MEERKIPPPWVPQSEVSHVYEPTTPNFEPGIPYAGENSDPYPEFNYISEEAAIRFAIHSEDEYDSDDSDVTVTDVEIMRIGSYEDFSFGREPSSTPTTPDRFAHDLGVEVLKSDPVIDGASVEQGWDLTVISPPSMKPCGPGPKLWLQPQDLFKLSSIFAPPAEPTISAPPVAPLFSLATPTVSVDFKLCLSTLPHCLALEPPPVLPPPLPPQQSTHVVNGTGTLFKLKVWLSQLWRPKPKQDPQLKRLSLLS